MKVDNSNMDDDEGEDMSSLGFKLEKLKDSMKETPNKEGLHQINPIHLNFRHSKSCFSHTYQRNFVAVDMCFLKGAYKGQLGVVSTKDTNGKITKLAVAFVSTEDRKEWFWFVGKVMGDFPTLKITTSDRLKVLIFRSLSQS